MNTAVTRNNIAALNQYAGELQRLEHLQEVEAQTGVHVDPDQYSVNLLDKIVARAGALMAHYRGRIAAREEDGA